MLPQGTGVLFAWLMVHGICFAYFIIPGNDLKKTER
jgi:hypothetical protein